MGAPDPNAVDENGLTPYERERAEKIARNIEKMKALGLPALGGLVGSAPNTASGFAPVRRKNPANTEPIAPFRIVLRDRTLKPVNYNVDSFDPEDDVEEGRDRKRSRRADTTRAKPCAKPRAKPRAKRSPGDLSDYEGGSDAEDDENAVDSDGGSDSDSDSWVDPDPPSADFILYGGSLDKKYEVPENRARANLAAAKWVNPSNWVEQFKINQKPINERRKARRLAEEEAAREKEERKLKRKRGEGAGPIVVLPGVAPTSDKKDAIGKTIHRKAHYTVKGAKGTTRAKCDGETECAKCGVTATSTWHGTDEKVCHSCYLGAKAGDGYVCPGCGSEDASNWHYAKGFLLCHDGQTVKQGVQICAKCFKKEPPCANAMCAGVGCQNKDIKVWCKSKHTKDPITDERLVMCQPCYNAEPARVGDECAQCGKCDPHAWARSKKLVRADGTPAPLCKSPCSSKETAQIKKEAKEA